MLPLVGRRMAAELPKPKGDLRAQLRAASSMLGEMGGLSEVEESDGGFFVCGYSCPLGPLVRSHP